MNPIKSMASIAEITRYGFKKAMSEIATPITGTISSGKQRLLNELNAFAFNGKTAVLPFGSFRIKKIDITGLKIGEFTSPSKGAHEKRIAKLGTSELKAPRFVDERKMMAIDSIQWEESYYTSTRKKLISGEKLSIKEEQFLKFINQEMEATKEPTTLYRMLSPHEGFEKEVQNGVIKVTDLTSTSSQYSDFFKYWEGFGHLETITTPQGTKKYCTPKYVLKMNIPQGTKVLDCNAKYALPDGQFHFPRMGEEVILPSGKCYVRKIDDELNLIEVDYMPN